MDSTHRKIELQSPADLTYLHANATLAAREKLDLHFPPSAAPEDNNDTMKSRVEEMVDAYISSVFSHARPNLNINGLEGKDMDEAIRMAETEGQELDPYDTKLAAKLQKLSGNIEALTLQLANLRRTAPAQAARAYADSLAKEQEAFEVARTRAEEEKLQSVKEEKLDVGAEKMRDWDECRNSWVAATAQLAEVKDKIGATGARLAQARDAAAYLDQAAK